jgi:hypothetical protein
LSTADLIRSDIDAGSVYYLNDPRLQATYPHYCIVVNINPAQDPTIVLVYASHRIRKVKERRKNCPAETLVEISHTQYTGFDKDSIIDCNDVLETDIEMLASKLRQGKLQTKPLMGLRLVRKLRKAILASNQIPPRVKDLLKE